MRSFQVSTLYCINIFITIYLLEVYTRPDDPIVFAADVRSAEPDDRVHRRHTDFRRRTTVPCFRIRRELREYIIVIIQYGRYNVSGKSGTIGTSAGLRWRTVRTPPVRNSTFDAGSLSIPRYTVTPRYTHIETLSSRHLAPTNYFALTARRRCCSDHRNCCRRIRAFISTPRAAASNRNIIVLANPFAPVSDSGWKIPEYTPHITVRTTRKRF